jgi:hypothetical protein
VIEEPVLPPMMGLLAAGGVAAAEGRQGPILVTVGVKYVGGTELHPLWSERVGI